MILCYFLQTNSLKRGVVLGSNVAHQRHNGRTALPLPRRFAGVPSHYGKDDASPLSGGFRHHTHYPATISGGHRLSQVGDGVKVIKKTTTKGIEWEKPK